MAGTTIRALTSHDVPSMLDLAERGHSRLLASLPFLPADAASALPEKLTRLIHEGVAYGVVDQGSLRTFLGMLQIPGLRGATVGGLCLEWAHGSADPGAATSDVRQLYRELAAELVRRDCRLNTVSVFATDDPVEAAFVQLGFGRFLANRAAPVARVRAALGDAPLLKGYAIARATAAHGEELSRLHAQLQAHLEASPVFLPKAEAWSTEQWLRWLPAEDAVAFIATHEGRVAGYIKAQNPQFDVTYAVHGGGVLGINGMFVDLEHRGTGVAQALLAAMASEANRRGLSVLSVDHETANLEADSFWSRYFEPVSWALERRL